MRRTIGYRVFAIVAYLMAAGGILVPGRSEAGSTAMVAPDKLKFGTDLKLSVVSGTKHWIVKVAGSYDPPSTSEATGETIEALDEHQLRLTGFAAQFMTAVRYCGYMYYAGKDPVREYLKSAFGVNAYDFKRLVRATREKTLNRIRARSSWRNFCGREIYNLFGPKGILFGSKGEYPNLEPWIKQIEVKKGMTKKQVEAEIEMNVAYYGNARCVPTSGGTDEQKEEAYKRRHRLDDDWYAAIGEQSIWFLNAAFYRLGPESLMNCKPFLRKYRHLPPQKR